MQQNEIPSANTALEQRDGLVMQTVVDAQNRPVVQLEYTPDRADQMATALVQLAAKARRDRTA